MKRLKKLNNPKMLSARIEKEDFEKLEEVLSQQSILSLQDFINFSVKALISGEIQARGSKFEICDAVTDMFNNHLEKS